VYEFSKAADKHGNVRSENEGDEWNCTWRVDRKDVERVLPRTCPHILKLFIPDKNRSR